MCPQLLMSQSDNRLSGKWFIQYITTHHLTQTYQNILQIIDKFLIFLHFQQNRLIQHKKSFQTVQFSTEYNPFVILVHQNISDKLGHMLRLLIIESTCRVIHIFGFRRCRSDDCTFRDSRNLCSRDLHFFFRERLIFFFDNLDL